MYYNLIIITELLRKLLLTGVDFWLELLIDNVDVSPNDVSVKLLSDNTFKDDALSVSYI